MTKIRIQYSKKNNCAYYNYYIERKSTTVKQYILVLALLTLHC